jgi:hypothetical protein
VEEVGIVDESELEPTVLGSNEGMDEDPRAKSKLEKLLDV